MSKDFVNFNVDGGEEDNRADKELVLVEFTALGGLP
jgi:hypothetical protein